MISSRRNWYWNQWQRNHVEYDGFKLLWFKGHESKRKMDKLIMEKLKMWRLKICSLTCLWTLFKFLLLEVSEVSTSMLIFSVKKNDKVQDKNCRTFKDWWIKVMMISKGVKLANPISSYSLSKFSGRNSHYMISLVDHNQSGSFNEAESSWRFF